MAISRDIRFSGQVSMQKFDMRSSRAIQLATLYCDVPSRNIASGLRFDVRFDSRHLFYISFQLRWTSHAEASRVSFQVSVQMLLTAGSAFRSARYARPITHAISKLSYRRNIEFNAILPTLIATCNKSPARTKQAPRSGAALFC